MPATGRPFAPNQRAPSIVAGSIAETAAATAAWLRSMAGPAYSPELIITCLMNV